MSLSATRLPRILIWLMALAVAATFVVAAWGKIVNPGDFAQATYRYRMLPLVLLHPFALFMPWLELIGGLALLLPPLRRGAALLVGLMNIMFITALITALARSLNIECGCFGAGGHGVDTGLIFRDLLMLVACALILIQRRS
jgi:putative oxidoreductase